ncbi:MAG: hypothetical protein ACLP9L_10725 [Thermoguttaceae bacterium]
MNPLPTYSEHPADGLREAYFRHTQVLLAAGENRDDAWRAARACLHQRGFDLRKLEHLPLGYFPSAEPIWHGLLRDGFAADEIRASNLLADSRLPGRLVGPIRDAGRRIISFWAKSPRQLDHSLYLSTDWKEQAGVFGLDEAYPVVAHGRHDLLLVEDIWDALLLHSHGCLGVGAIGSSPAEISPRRWERLDELGIHRLTLVVDSFHDSHEACVAAIRQAVFSWRAPAIYVLPPTAVHGAWQSWQQGRAANAATVEKLVSAHRIHGFHYLALSLIALHKGEGPWTDAARRAALGEARRFYGTAHQRNVPQLDAFFLPPLLEALGLNWGDRTAWHDSWLEDSASSNGSAWADPASAPGPSSSDESSEHAACEPQPVEHEVAASNPADEEIVLESVGAEPVLVGHPPVGAAPRAARPGSSDYCEFHQCERIVCLCWD